MSLAALQHSANVPLLARTLRKRRGQTGGERSYCFYGTVDRSDRDFPWLMCCMEARTIECPENLAPFSSEMIQSWYRITHHISTHWEGLRAHVARELGKVTYFNMFIFQRALTETLPATTN
eukprot:scpid20917/ scgid14500/ 